MPTEVFVDSGGWIAIADPHDGQHQAETRIYRRLIFDQALLVVTDLIVAESYVLIRRARGSAGALEFLRRLELTTRLVRISPTPPTMQRAEALLAQYSDQDFSYVDAVSFVVMHERGITEAFAFDHHFMTVGFVTLN